MTVRLTSGLGNRFFQLAAAATYAAAHDRQLVIFDDWVPEAVHDASANEVLWTIVKATHVPHGPPSGTYTVVRGSYETILEHESTSELVVLEGYFQDARFAEGLRPYVQDFLNSVTRQVPRQSNIVFLHVRLGDYKHTTGNMHYINIGRFYQRAIPLVETSKTFEIYSDEPAKAEEIVGPFLGKHNYAMAPRGELMTTLKHLISCSGAIIANSTFSWWAAQFMVWSWRFAFVMVPEPWRRLKVLPNLLWKISRRIEPIGTMVVPGSNQWKGIEFDAVKVLGSEVIIVSAIVTAIVGIILLAIYRSAAIRYSMKRLAVTGATALAVNGLVAAV